MAISDTIANDSSDPVVSKDPGLKETVDAGNETVQPPLKGTLLGGELGRYKILDRLGAGGMGTVYLAQDSQFDIKVALKVPQFTSANDQQIIQRFYREARSAIKLRHSNICPVYDVGEIGGQHYLTMAYIDGQPLSACIDASRPIPERQIAWIVHKIALALQEAHQNGIIHRDLKPGNIMFDTKRNEPVVMDFGLASQIDGPADSRLTQSGTMVGSPGYMSPEQVSNARDLIGPPSDIYSLGVILYELLACRLPFEGSAAVVFGMIALKEPEPPSRYRPGIAPALEAICLKAMAKKIDDRFATMHAFAKSLAAFVNSQPSSPDVTDTMVADSFDSTQFLSVLENSANAPARLSGQATVTERIERKPNQAQQVPARSDIAVWIGSSVVVTLAVVALAFAMLNRGTPSISQGTAPVGGIPPVATGEPAGGHASDAREEEVVADQPDKSSQKHPEDETDSEPFQRPGRGRRGPPPFLPDGPPDFHSGFPGPGPDEPFEFDAADYDHNGFLEFPECKPQIVDRADTDKDFRVSRAEFDAAKLKWKRALFDGPTDEQIERLGLPARPPGSPPGRRGPPPDDN